MADRRYSGDGTVLTRPCLSDGRIVLKVRPCDKRSLFIIKKMGILRDLMI